jgi:hypothetical protein
MTQQGEAAIQGQMVPGTSQPLRYLVDEIMEPTNAMLQVPWDRMGKKKDVAHGMVQPPNPEARSTAGPSHPSMSCWK